jgi:hypothetical protein
LKAGGEADGAQHAQAVFFKAAGAAADGEKTLHWFETPIVDASGDTVARVRKQVYVRRKREA